MPTITPATGAAERIGRNVAAELTRYRVTQADAAAEVGLSRRAFLARMAGRHGGLTHDHLDALALMLGIPVETFHARHPADREAGTADIEVVGLLAAAILLVAAMWAAIVGFGRLVLWLAGVTDAATLAALAVGLGGAIGLGHLAATAAQALYRRRADRTTT